MYQIYRYTAPDGRVYIGCTVRTLKERAGEGGIGYKDATRFWNAIQEFGWDSFKVDVIATTEDADEATYLEDYYINESNSLDISCGFNSIRSGGAKTELTRAKQSATMQSLLNNPDSYFRSEARYRKQSAAIRLALSRPEVRARMSKAAKNAWKDANSVLNTQEYRDRISDTMKRHWKDPNSVFNSPEYQERRDSAAREAANRPEVREKKSVSMRSLWQDSEYRSRQVASLTSAANRPEVRQKRIDGIKSFNATPGQYEVRCARQLIIQNDPEVKRKKREARLGKLWVHRIEGTRVLKKIVTETELESYLESGWTQGMGPRKVIKEE